MRLVHSTYLSILTFEYCMSNHLFTISLFYTAHSLHIYVSVTIGVAHIFTMFRWKVADLLARTVFNDQCGWIASSICILSYPLKQQIKENITHAYFVHVVLIKLKPTNKKK